jgi:hypothetical protein
MIHDRAAPRRHWVDDLAEAVGRAIRDLRVGPFLVHEHVTFDSFECPPEVTTDDPVRFDHTAAFAAWGPVVIELGQIHSIDPGLAWAYGVRAGAVSHISWVVDDLDAEVRRLTGLGCELINTARAGPIQCGGTWAGPRSRTRSGSRGQSGDSWHARAARRTRRRVGRQRSGATDAPVGTRAVTASARPFRFGLLSSAGTAQGWQVAAPTPAGRLSTLETVPTETPARAATSLIPGDVIGRHPTRGRGALVEVSSCHPDGTVHARCPPPRDHARFGQSGEGPRALSETCMIAGGGAWVPRAEGRLTGGTAAQLLAELATGLVLRPSRPVPTCQPQPEWLRGDGQRVGELLMGAAPDLRDHSGAAVTPLLHGWRR